MNLIKRLTGGIMAWAMVSSLLSACSQFETREVVVDKPQSLIDQEALDSLPNLKTNIDRNGQPNFKLGVALGTADIVNNSPLYRLMQSQFDQVSVNLNHLDFVQTDGSVVLNDLPLALDTNKAVGMGMYVGNLVWHEKQNSSYLNSLIADVVLPGQSGKDVVVDFDSQAIGSTFPTTGPEASAKIEADPDGKSGKALRVKKNTGTAFPQITVTLPQGKTLGQYKSVTIDFKGGGCCGFYGAGMRMAITTSLGNPTLTGFGGPSSFGIGDNTWGRGLIDLPLSALNLTPEQKALNTFVLTIGSQTGSPDYLLDNVTFKWEIPGQTIVKSPEEKKSIITAELDKWIKAVGEAGKDKVQAWSVIYQPIDESDPSKLRSGVTINPKPENTFYWQDYLGKDYAATAIGMIKQYANANDKIFFTETGLIDKPAKIQGLVDLINYTTGKGAKVDGIATELSLNLDADKTKIESMLQALAGTGKLIKISALDIGTGGTTAQATPALYQEQADMYKWFVQAYIRVIPAAQRAGITFKSPTDRASGDGWRANEPVGLWTNVTSGSPVKLGIQRKLAYKGVLEALQGK